MRTDKHPIENAGRLMVLFIAEAVTLSHVARPAVLAQALDSDLYEVSFVADPRYNHLFSELSDYRVDIWSVSSQAFLKVSVTIMCVNHRDRFNFGRSRSTL